MKKKLLWFILLPLSVVLIYFFWIKIKPYLNLSNNTLNVVVNAPLDIDKLQIAQGFFSINRTSDAELFKQKSHTIFKGEQTKTLYNDYGENDFLLIYNDSCYFQFRHFKTNNKQIDQYYFELTLNEQELLLQTTITGTNPMEFSHAMTPIAEAYLHNYNTPMK